MDFDQPRTWTRPYYPSFNGLRGIAILFVFLRHYAGLVTHWPLFQALWIGVDLFFVLSGFLITGILFDSLHERQFFRTFYIRRALRIFPLYLALFATLFALSLLFPGAGSNRSAVVFLLYIGNLAVPILDLAKHPATVIRLLVHHRVVTLALGHLWSLCIEEQFYLIWPLAVFLVRDRHRLMTIALSGVLLTVLLRTAGFLLAPQALLESGFIYSETFFRCDSLLVGAWCALWLRGVTLTSKELRVKAYTWGLPAAAITLCGCVLTLGRWPRLFTNPFLSTVGYTGIAITAGSLIILSIDEGSWLSFFLRLPGLSTLGSVSYGFYLFHDLPKVVLEAFLLHHQHLHLLRWLAVPSLFGIVALLSWLSFQFYEKPFLRLKVRFAPASPPEKLLLETTSPGVNVHSAFPYMYRKDNSASSA